MSNIQTVKKYWDNRPCNIRHSQKEIGTLEYFEEVEKKKFFVEPHIVEFSNFPAWNNKSVLEIGSGIGTMAINFAKSGANYTGVELSEESLKLTKKRFEVYGQEGTFYQGNAEELTSFIPVKKYDLIYSFGVIHHSPNPRKIIQEMRPYMHEQSVLKLMIYAKDSWKNIMIENGFDQPEAQSGCPIAFTYTREEARKLLDGFDIIDMQQEHIFPYEIESYRKNNHVKVPWFANMPEDMFKAIEKRLGWHMLITAKLSKDIDK
jgi:ubiquinone/menaquinone biosynthesis C-methylase UbiE